MGTGHRKLELTRWFVRYAVPLAQLIATGSFPGKVFPASKASAVRGGEVNKVFSRGRGTKWWALSSITQLSSTAQRRFINPGHNIAEGMTDRRWQHIAKFLIEMRSSATYFIDILSWNGTRMVALAGYLSCSAPNADQPTRGKSRVL